MTAYGKNRILKLTAVLLIVSFTFFEVPFSLASEPVIQNTTAIPTESFDAVPEPAAPETIVQEPTSAFLSSETNLSDPKDDSPEGTKEAVAAYLGVHPEDVIDIHFIHRKDAVFCLGTGCPTWTGYLDVTVGGNEREKHYVGTATGGWFDAGPERPPSVFLIETALEVEAVVAVTKYLNIWMQDIKLIESSFRKDEIYCLGTGCPIWRADISLVIQHGEHPRKYYEGTVTKIFTEPKNTYQINLREIENPSKLRHLLIMGTNREIETAKATLGELQIEARQLEANFREIKREFESDVRELVKNVKRVMRGLESILGSDNLSEETRGKIETFLKKSDTYLNERLESDVRIYLKTLKIQMLSSVQAKIESWSQYLASLKTYRRQVYAARTSDELKYLAEHFPVRKEIHPVYPAVSPVDPRPRLQKLIVNGRHLLRIAKAELNLG
ncbi:MAG: hypothetical protein HY583_04045 [Candidatus Omnitrophica bacterium]|nr:hypothetical protein [Candidatus Omnitrophota bacterium]